MHASKELIDCMAGAPGAHYIVSDDPLDTGDFLCSACDPDY